MTTASPQYRTGAIPPPYDPRDYPFDAARIGAPEPEALPPSVDLRCGSQRPTRARPVGPVRNQSQEGSCVAHSVTELLEALYMRKRGRFTRLSPAFTYYETRLKEGTQDQDAGSDPRDAMTVSVQMGSCIEGRDAYVAGQYTTPPSASAVRSALSYRLSSYHACASPTEVKQALAAGQPVIVTIDGSGPFQDTGSDGVVPQAALDKSRDWDHEVLFVGFDDPSGYWLLQNSWGNWAAEGYFYVPQSRWDFFLSPFTGALS